MPKLAFDSHVISQFKPAGPSIARANTSNDGGSGFASLMDDVATPAKPDRKQNDHGRVGERADRPAQRAEPRKSDPKPTSAKTDKKPDEPTEKVESDDHAVKTAAETDAAETKPADEEKPEAAVITAATGPLAEQIVAVATIVAPAATADTASEATEDEASLAADAGLAGKASAIGLVDDMPKDKPAAKAAQAPTPAGPELPHELQGKAPEIHAAKDGIPAPAPAAEEKSEKSAAKSDQAFETLLAADPAKPQSAPSLPAPHGQQHLAQTHAAAAAQAPAVNLPPAPAVTIAALPVEIATRALDGSNRFEIRLDPAELSRIDVRLDIDGGGNVTSRLIVDRADTLDLLRRDAHQLERALQDAGLKTSDNGLQFSLRDQGFAGRDGQGQSSSAAKIFVADHNAPAVEALPYRPSVKLGALDIRV